MKHELEQLIAAGVSRRFGVTTEIELTRTDPQFGEYATNIALQIAKSLQMNPRQIAEQLIGDLKEQGGEWLHDASVAGPGFINLRLNDAALVRSINEKPPRSLAGQKVLVEYSDPNPMKPLHAGHLYTTLIGDSIARLIENAGAETIRLNFGGDVGPHVARSIWSIIRQLGGEYPDKLTDIPEDERPSWLGARYVEGNAAYEDDETAKAEIIAINKKIYALHETGDKTSPLAQIYWTCRQWSYEYFAELYRQLQVVPFDRFIPESEVAPLGLKTVQEQLDKGVFTVSDGAVVYPESKSGLHTRVFINREGLPTYEAKDVGLSLTKWQDYGFDESVIITANEQAQYMQVVMAAIKEFAPEAAERTNHITHGVVKLTGGVKMSSRKGNIVSAMDILSATREAGQKSNTNPNEDTIIASIKYAFVRTRIGADIIYDPTESVALEGNSGPYLQYAHARAKSILAKAGQATDAEPTKNPSPLGFSDGERSLLVKLGEYPEVIEKATKELMPHHICNYLYELAQEFNRFYEHNRVLGDYRQEVRLWLISNYASTLANGLGLLGIHAPDKM